MPRPRLSSQQKAIRRGGRLPTGRRVLYESHPGPQTAFMVTPAQEVLYGGAYAGGKSWALRAWAVRFCMTYPGAQVVLFRRSYRELEDTHILAIQQEVPTSVATYSSGSHNVIFDNGSVFMLRYCEADADVATYQTSEFDAILFDELTQFSEYQYVGLVARCRSTKSWWPGPMIRAGATPRWTGLAWVKARWVDSAPTNVIWEAPASEGGLTRQFIPARVQDNPTLLKADPTYMERLKMLSEEEYRAFALGDWEVFSGQFFQRWRADVHFVESFDIPPDWDRWLGVDYGFNAPYAALWVARPPGTQTIWFYREHYGSGVKLEEQVFSAWRATSDAEEKLKGVVLDPSLFGKVNVKGERIRPIADDWRDRFGKTTNVYRGNNERVPGWRLMRQMIDWQGGPGDRVLVPPRFFVMNTCPNLARTIPLLVADKHNVEDVDTDGEDHAGDAARYLIRHIFEGSGRADQQQRYYMGPRGIVVGRPPVYNPSSIPALLGRE